MADATLEAGLDRRPVAGGHGRAATGIAIPQNPDDLTWA